MSQTAAGSSRWNNASGANVNRDVVFGEGSFKRVYKGKYDGGQRAGEACVVKEMRSGPTWLNSVFDSEIEVVNRAVEIIERFNNAGHIDKRILMNRPAVWLYTTSCGANIAGSAVLVEPFISNYQKFNSNSGWVSPVQQKWNQVMQALSHFSYHCSSGQFVLCDLQGGVYQHTIALTDPLVCSRDGRYGAADLGQRGIEQFFSTHICNAYCSRAWQKPTSARSHFPIVPGTSMLGSRDGQLLVPTRASRPTLDPTAHQGRSY